MECVVFDTSFLLNSVKARVDFVRELREKLGSFRIIVTSPVMMELQKLAMKSTDASVALQIIGKNDSELVESGMKADDSVVNVASGMGCYVASTDREVRQKARKLGLRLVTLREGRHIQV
jgi:rRNA-processing protein FCF1